MNSCEYRSILESNVEAVCLTDKAWPNVLRTSTAVNLQQEWLEKNWCAVAQSLDVNLLWQHLKKLRNCHKL